MLKFSNPLTLIEKQSSESWSWWADQPEYDMRLSELKRSLKNWQVNKGIINENNTEDTDNNKHRALLLIDYKVRLLNALYKNEGVIIKKICLL